MAKTDKGSTSHGIRSRADFVCDAAGGQLAVRIRGEIDHHTAVEVRQGIDTLLFERRPRRLLLDLSAVSFMDSSGLGLIMGRLSVMRELGGELVVWNPSREVLRIVTLAGLERLVRIEYPPDRIPDRVPDRLAERMPPRQPDPSAACERVTGAVADPGASEHGRAIGVSGEGAGRGRDAATVSSPGSAGRVREGSSTALEHRDGRVPANPDRGAGRPRVRAEERTGPRPGRADRGGEAPVRARSAPPTASPREAVKDPKNHENHHKTHHAITTRNHEITTAVVTPNDDNFAMAVPNGIKSAPRTPKPRSDDKRKEKDA